MIGEYDKLIGLIYDGVNDDAPWNLALARVANAVSAAGVGLGMQDMQTHQFRSLGAFGIDPELSETYRRLAPGNKIWQEIGRRREPLKDQMVMPKADLVRTELFADWLSPQNFYSVMAFPTLFKDRASAVLVAFRNPSLGDFEADDLMKLGRFAGHFGRALGIRLDRERTADELTVAKLTLDSSADAILLVDPGLRLIHANAAARAMLDAGCAIRSHQGRLELCDPATHAIVAQMTAGARGGEFRLDEPGRAQLIVRLHPCPEGFAVTGAGHMTMRITDPSGQRDRPTPARLRSRLGLTRRQSEAIAALASGATEKEAAETLGVSAPTLQTHIRRAYDKLDLRSRAELVALLARHGFDTARQGKIISAMSSAQMTMPKPDSCFDVLYRSKSGEG
jgi:DNA-binding CsgD family transcriptional regulator/PAS domain-containing protein